MNHPPANQYSSTVPLNYRTSSLAVNVNRVVATVSFFSSSALLEGDTVLRVDFTAISSSWDRIDPDVCNKFKYLKTPTEKNSQEGPSLSDP